MFHQYMYGFTHVICNAAGSIIAASVNKSVGPLMAAAPTLLHELERIAAGEEPAREIAQSAVESFIEREGMALADWDPHRGRPRLRIVGEAI